MAKFEPGFKMNFYLDEETRDLLEQDARLFEIFKKDNVTPNRNRFMNKLVAGYYDQYREESESKKKEIESLLNGRSVKSDEDLLNDITKCFLLPSSVAGKKKNVKQLSFKPTDENFDRIKLIQKDRDTNNETIKKMVFSYLQNPLYRREQIIFNDNYIVLKEACRKHSTVSVMTTKNQSYTVIPYKLVEAREEMCNYLLCAEIQKGGKLSPKSFRLCRIQRCTKTCGNTPPVRLTDKVMDLLKNSARCPAFVLTEENSIRVKLNRKGMENYRMIRTNRPEYDSMEETEDGCILDFKCSNYQAFVYFSRFGNSAEIISPEPLRREMKKYYQKALDLYNNDVNTEG